MRSRQHRRFNSGAANVDATRGAAHKRHRDAIADFRIRDPANGALAPKAHQHAATPVGRDFALQLRRLARRGARAERKGPRILAGGRRDRHVRLSGHAKPDHPFPAHDFNILVAPPRTHHARKIDAAVRVEQQPDGFTAPERSRARRLRPRHGNARDVRFFHQLHARCAGDRRRRGHGRFARARSGRALLQSAFGLEQVHDNAIAVHKMALAHAGFERQLQANRRAGGADAAHLAHQARRRRAQFGDVYVGGVREAQVEAIAVQQRRQRRRAREAEHEARVILLHADADRG